MPEEPKPKTIPASFRLSSKAHKELHDRAKLANISPRAWLESAILENRTQIIARQKPHPELKPLLFQVNKAGNNLNQLAHRFNSLRLENKLTAADFLEGLRKLEQIELDLAEALANARPD
ncbi:hypothetical protein J2W32_006502 [Variovorax boronicumulans]|uniref:Plasmid mobilization relaxosome protein MobC n=1 Tax=Variovorax boronicumulans TaxID=436515 RepID=A0AAW8DBU8_9BURK|nr:plasmid mobilization relaxosome protein MobC [Variovorax boronicumulans]MDP9897341.1 hypothetical protein [Variovorax boronicumulans]MDQ0057425.1 hypothetical protein [Variovorax boronicumulans]